MIKQQTFIDRAEKLLAEADSLLGKIVTDHDHQGENFEESSSKNTPEKNQISNHNSELLVTSDHEKDKSKQNNPGVVEVL